MSQKIYLASKSPRRQELLKLMNLDFEVLLNDVDESYPTTLNTMEVAEYIAKKKSDATECPANGILITADTIVLLGSEILGKPTDRENAIQMLKKLSGNVHQVITGVCLKSNNEYYSFSETTEVAFNDLSEGEIAFYVDNYQPLDKAGSYGIQDWIGLIGIGKINGSYTNVVGLPTEKLYTFLRKFNAV